VRVPISEAKGQLTDLVRRAQQGEDVVLTRHGQAAVRLAPIARVADARARLRLMNELQDSAANKAKPGPDAAHSQDFLYDEDGLPG
jgi:prevent-host-death family protein